MIRKDIDQFLLTIPKDVTLVVASKYLTSEDILFLYKKGVKNFGENRVEDFLRKQEELKDYDISWHFIGHLQRNKARKVLNKINYLHSLDSLLLADLIDKNVDKPLDTFIEVSINLEENKNGVPYYEVIDFVKNLNKYRNIHLVGLMMMAVSASSISSLHDQFHKLKELQIEIKDKLGIDLPYLSMGMSDDYLIAIEEGATHIRLGRIVLEK